MGEVSTQSPVSTSEGSYLIEYHILQRLDYHPSPGKAC